MGNMSFRIFLELLAFAGLVYCSDEFRIISGRRVSILEFPYHAEIQKRRSHWCGGSIINELFILTAAHCFFKGKHLWLLPGTAGLVRVAQLLFRLQGFPDLIFLLLVLLELLLMFKYFRESVRLYKIIVGNDEPLKNGTVYSVRQFIIHEKYDNLSDMDQYDIALVELMQPLRFSDRVQPVSLAQETPKSEKMGWVIGFGKTNPKHIGSTKYLMAVELPVVSLKACRQILSMVADDMICVGKKKGTGDACKGDSGGPYVVEDELVGLVAWGIGCGRKGVPGVYTNVAYYREWIKSKMAEHSKSVLC